MKPFDLEAAKRGELIVTRDGRSVNNKGLTMNKIEQNVIAWAKARGIYEHSTIQAQVLKAVSEMGELADATIKGDRDAFTDAIGDVMVCLTNAAFMHGTDLTECYSRAYDEIKDRKGRMVSGGAFVKESGQ